MHPRRRFLGLAFALPLVGAGCSASVPPGPLPDGGPPRVVSRPPDGVSMRQLGFANGPVDVVFLPATAQIVRKVDQVNVTSAFGPASEGPLVGDFLRRTLPSNTWTIDGDAGGSLLFHNGGYDGAYTLSADLWAVTIRRKPL